MPDALTRRIDWLKLRSRIARNNGDHILRAELEETAEILERLTRGMQGAILDPERWKDHIQNAISKIEDRATR